MVDESTITAFMSLFRGRTDAWGSMEGKANKEKVTLKHYERHLKGEISLGIYMLQDDKTCHFFAIDLDERDIDKAFKLRQAFTEFNINSYLAYSKSKGFHCYVFANENDPFPAYNVRRLCHGILAKLDIPAEVFPKQDELDEQTPLGNYINLPCFGNSRMFFTTKAALVSVVDAVKWIQRVPKNLLEEALKALPMPPKHTVLKVKKGRPKKEKGPQCMETILKGVSSGSRDVAAFALARHYLSQEFIEPEVFQLLQQWDERNKPPLNDPHLLQTKVRSAAKGYGFGCSSIQDEPLLAPFCVGEENCGWIKQVLQEKRKKGSIRDLSFYETETHLYEQIVQEGRCLFAAYEKATGKVQYVPSIDYPDFTIVPIQGAEISENVVTFPDSVLEYGSILELKNEVRDLIYSYVDIDDEHLEYSSWYVLLSWVYDKLNTISYLRFLGDTGVGKSRALDVIGRLCYKPLMMAGAVTPAPIYREIKRFRGTVILEEADFRDTTEKGEVITILNCGIERGRAVIRCSQENPDILEVLPCYGPKLFATRFTFHDKALEARCITCVMEETDRVEIPVILGSRFYKRAQKLRNKLLLWRFHQWEKIDSDAVEEIDLGPIEPRLKQMGLPFAIPFKDLKDVMEDFRRFMQVRQVEIIQQRSESDEGRIVAAIFKLAQALGKEWVSVGAIAEELSSEKITFPPAKVGRHLRSLNLKSVKQRRVGEDKQAHYILWDDARMWRLCRRYIPVTEREDFQYLLKEPSQYLLKESSIDMEI